MRTKSFSTRSVVLTLVAGLLFAGCSETPGTATPPVTSPTSPTSVSGPVSSSAPTSEDVPESTSELPSPPETTTADTTTPESSVADTSTGETGTSETGTAETNTFPEITVNTTDQDAVNALTTMEKGLLTAEELGNGFAKGNYTPADPTDTTGKLPCGQVSTSVMFPNALRTGTTLGKGNEALMEETLNLFLDDTTAAAAYEYALEGLNCAEGKVGDVVVQIENAGDVSKEIGVEAANAWTAAIGSDTAVLIAFKRGSLTAGFTFVVAEGVDSSTLPNPIDLATAVVKKLNDAGL